MRAGKPYAYSGGELLLEASAPSRGGPREEVKIVSQGVAVKPFRFATAGCARPKHFNSRRRILLNYEHRAVLARLA